MQNKLDMFQRPLPSRWRRLVLEFKYRILEEKYQTKTMKVDVLKENSVPVLFDPDEKETEDTATAEEEGNAENRMSQSVEESKTRLRKWINKICNDTVVWQIVYDLVDSKWFPSVIMVVILINTVILLLQTFQEIQVYEAYWFNLADMVFTSVYITEAVLKMIALGSGYFKDGWNILDFVIVNVSISDAFLPLLLQNVGNLSGAAALRVLRVFKVIRALRALRVLRSITFLKKLLIIIQTCLESVRSIGGIVGVMTLFLYIFSVIGRGLFGTYNKEMFGTLVRSALTLFMMLTLDDVADLYRYSDRADIFLFVFLYVIIEYFILLSLFLAILVDNIQLVGHASEEEDEEMEKLMQQRLRRESYKYLAEKDAEQADIMMQQSLKEKLAIHYYQELVQKQQINEEEMSLLQKHFQVLTCIELHCNMSRRTQNLLETLTDIYADSDSDQE